MTDWRFGAIAGILAGLVSGTIFSIVAYVGMVAFLSTQNAGLESLILSGIIGGIMVGLCAGLIYAHTRDGLPGKNSTAKALTMALVFSLPWGLSWLLALPPTTTMVPSDYMQWIHSFGIEIQWFDVNTAPQQLMGLEGFLSSGSYFAAYILALLVWIFMFGTLLGYIWVKRTRFGREHESM
nr:hypothetical protein [Candidatus Njordarchaeota archaeon]